MTTADAAICKKVRQHRERIAALKDRYVWDETAADRAVRFIERNIKHWKAPHAGKPFILADWQREDVVKPLFGLKREDGTRLFREAYIQIARKNGKSSLVAALLLLILYTDGNGSELYTAATKRDQAKIVFGDCVKFVRSTPVLRRRARVLKQKIEIPKTDSVLMPLSSDYQSMDGLNISAASIDELHAHPTPDLHDVIVTATGAREQPLVLNITTAGAGEQGVCHDMYEYAEKVLDGAVEDDAFFAFVAEADKELPWDSPVAYRQANPNLGVSVREEYLQRELAKAKELPVYKRTYQRYSLNRWVEAGASKWIPIERWKACQRAYSRADLAGRRCFGGLDLSSTTDTTALSLVFPWEDGTVRLLVFYWIPEDNIAERVRKDRVPYDAWRDQGFLEATPGSVIDYEVIAARIGQLREEFNIELVAYDDWNACQLNTQLEDEGLAMVKFIQGLKSFHYPSTEFERLILGQNLHHDGNPVTTWMASNVKVRVDPSGKMRPVKDYKSSRERIDGIIASIMALDCHLRAEAGDGEIDLSSIPADFRAIAGL